MISFLFARSAKYFTPVTARGSAIVEREASAESSAPPASHTNGMTWCTRSHAVLPGWPSGCTRRPSTYCTLSRILWSAPRNESHVLNALAGSTPAFL
jgi:hypothetical protein